MTSTASAEATSLEPGHAGGGARRASKRARQRARRRAGTTSSDGDSSAPPSAGPDPGLLLTQPTTTAPERATPAEDADAEPGQGVERHRAKHGPSSTTRHARLRRGRRMMVTALGLLVVTGVALVLIGLDVIWSSTAGRYVADGLQPDDPNYVALVAPTPTMLVLSTDQDDTLVGVALLALHARDTGGSVILVPVGTTVSEQRGDAATDGAGSDAGATEGTDADDGAGVDAPEGTEGTDGTESTDQTTEQPTDGSEDSSAEGSGVEQTETLAAAYASDGVTGVETGVEEIFGAAVGDTMVVDDAGWESLLAPVDRLELDLPDPLGDRWPAGEVELAADEVGEFLRAAADGESELNRLARHRLFWETWMSAVGEVGEGAVPGEVDGGVGRFVLGLSLGPPSVVDLPVTAESEPDSQGGERFAVSPGVIGDIVASEIPYPMEPWAGSRIRVKLLNGTTESDLVVRATAPLVAANAEIAVTGNAADFDADRTQVLYAEEDQRLAATALRDALGVGVVEEAPSSGERPPDEDGERIDVTVILGADALGSIGRLETTD